MSTPISQCAIFKAAKCDKAYDRLIDALEYNKRKGSMSIYPCTHNPRCTATDEQLNALLARIENESRSKGNTSKSIKR